MKRKMVATVFAATLVLSSSLYGGMNLSPESFPSACPDGGMSINRLTGSPIKFSDIDGPGGLTCPIYKGRVVVEPSVEEGRVFLCVTPEVPKGLKEQTKHRECQQFFRTMVPKEVWETMLADIENSNHQQERFAGNLQGSKLTGASMRAKLQKRQ